VRYATRGFLRTPAGGRTEKRGAYRLEMSVKGPAKAQGPLQYPRGVELAIEKDELGVFRDHKQVFWAASESGRFMANLVVTYDPDLAPGAPGGPFGRWGQGDGSALRLVFFADRPLTQIGIGEDPVDALLFLGPDANVPEYQGTECFHFVRTVKADDKRDDKDRVHFQQGFTESTWFARGKGLVRLEQRVNGKTSMLWRLKSFSRGEAAAKEGNAAAPPKAPRRTFIRSTAVSIKYEYGDGTMRAAGIATGATFERKQDNKAVATAEGAELVDEDGERLIKVALKLKPEAEAVSTLVAWFKPGAGLRDAAVRKVAVDGRWESRYHYDGEHKEFGIPRVVTHDLKTGKKVAETRDIKVLGGGLFSGEEVGFNGDKEVFRSSFVRHAGTGLLVREDAQSGQLPTDYHHYEFVLTGWPAGRR